MDRTSAATAIWDFLGSKNLNVFLLVSGSVYAVMLSIWGAASPNQAVIRIANSLPMKTWLIFFLANNLLCLMRHFSLALKACALDNTKPTLDSLRKKRNQVTAASRRPAAEIAPQLAERLRARRFKVTLSRDRLAFRAVRRRWAPLGTVLFHGSFFLLIAGVVISPLVRTSGQVIVAQGDTFDTKQQGRLIQVEPEDSGGRLPDFGFTVEEIRPRFWRNELLFTDMRARIRPTGSKRDKDVLLTSAYKPGPATYVTLIGIGYAPYFKVIDDDGREVESGFVNLTTFPSGTEDSFSLESMPYTVYLKVVPDYAVVKGKFINRSNNLRRPGYLVKVKIGRETVYNRFTKPSDTINVGRLHLSFPKIVYWGQFHISHNPGLLLVWVSFVAGLAGLTWRLIWYRKDIAVLVVPGREASEVHLHGRSDYFPRLIIEELRAWAKEIESWPDGPALDGRQRVGTI